VSWKKSPPPSPYHLPFPLFSLPSLLSLFPPSSCSFSTTDYHLVIICSNEDEDKSHIISRLSPHKKHFTGLRDVAKYQEYLKIRFTGTMPLQFQTLRFATQGIHASIVDLEEYVYCVGMFLHVPTYVDNTKRSTHFFSWTGNEHASYLWLVGRIRLLSTHVQTCAQFLRTSGQFHPVWDGEVPLHYKNG